MRRTYGSKSSGCAGKNRPKNHVIHRSITITGTIVHKSKYIRYIYIYMCVFVSIYVWHGPISKLLYCPTGRGQRRFNPVLLTDAWLMTVDYRRTIERCWCTWFIFLQWYQSPLLSNLTEFSKWVLLRGFLLLNVYCCNSNAYGKVCVSIRISRRLYMYVCTGFQIIDNYCIFSQRSRSVCWKTDETYVNPFKHTGNRRYVPRLRS